MKLFLIIISLFLGLSSFAQLYPFYNNYKWEKEPVLINRNVKDALYYYNKYMLSIEYEYDSYYGKHYKYKTHHYRIKLNSHVAIEKFNKVYISMEDVVSLKNLNARVIKTSGVVEIKPKVEEFYSSEESEQYYYFPVSGLELGDELEILYTLKMNPAADGDQFFFQGEQPIFNFDFYFITANDTYFNFLAHNGLPKPELVDTILHRHQWVSHLDSIPAFKVEYFSEYNNSTMKLDATLRGFDKPSDKSYSPYSNFDAEVNGFFNLPLNKKDVNAVLALSERLGISRKNSIEKNIRIIENYIKTEIAISSAVPFGTSLRDMIENERANSVGVILMYMAMFRENDILFEYGLTSNRYDTYFTDQIESMKFLQYSIFYFPDIKAYMGPIDFGTRLGYLKADWVPNNAYMVKMKQYPIRESTGKIMPVPGTAARQNIDSTTIRIKIADNYQDISIEIERYIIGYKAGAYQSYYYLYNDSKREEKHQELLDVIVDNSRFKMTEIVNVAPEDAFVKPLIIKGYVTELNLPMLEFADQIVIFKLGQLFGEYVDVKEIEKKKTDFIFGNAFSSANVIEIEFPKGAKITAPTSIMQSDDICAHPDIVIFSNLTIEDNKVIYTQGETFNSNRYSIEDKSVMIDVFKYWNSLHKMNLIIER